MTRVLCLLVLSGCGGAADDSRDPAGPQVDDTGSELVDGGAGDGGAGDGGAGDGGAGDGGAGDGGAGDGGAGDGGTAVAVEPPLDGSSGGGGGADFPTGTTQTTDGISFGLLAPSGISGRDFVPLLLVISGTEGSSVMLSNMRQVAAHVGLDDALIAVLDGRTASAGDAAVVLDGLRERYDIDNDRTWLLSESAGTAAGLELALQQRQSWFAAVWFNDVNTRAEPRLGTAALGVRPWANVGPGGDWPDAEAIVSALDVAGYQLPADAPYSGAGADTHGSTDQFLAATRFFAGKER